MADIEGPSHRSSAAHIHSRADVAMPLNEERRMSTITHPQSITGGSKHVDREQTDGMLRHTRLAHEPREYLQKREELRLAEMEMLRNIERVAALRRALPPGAEVTDYLFQEGPRDLNGADSPISSVRLSELFSGPERPLIVYHFMYGKRNTTACPMCTMWIDTFNGIAPHLAQNVDLAIVAAADPATLRAHARARGWHNLRLLSAADNTFKYDFRSEDAEGRQDSALSVFTRDAEGRLRHFYTTHPWLDADMNERGIDLLQPVYNMLDLTPQGRGSWYASLEYGTRVNWVPHTR
jgi:predicted dithiol-disulfide oxidoreductase (DUF899 family)